MRLLWSFLALTALTATALAQVDWTEQGDAGDLPETAQATGTDTNTPLSSISGALDANDVDMFAIYIADPDRRTNACAVAGRSRVASWTGSTSAGTYQIVLQGAFTAPLGADPADCPPFDGWDETDNGGGDAERDLLFKCVVSPSACRNLREPLAPSGDDL
jgi:hypothetical protein